MTTEQPQGQPAEQPPPKRGPRPVGPLEEELDVYPVRPPEEDPRWAVWMVWIWVVIGTGTFLFLLALTILGYFVD